MFRVLGICNFGWFQEKNCAHFQLSCSWSITYLAKGQLILECAFGVFKSSRNPGKEFIDFLEDLKTPKRHFEIN